MISRPTAIGIVGVIVVIIALILNHEDKRESEEPLKNKTSVAKNQVSQNRKTEKKEPSIATTAKNNTDAETTLKKPKKKPSFDSPKSFEDASARLEEIVETLEDGDLSLEDAISLYEEGVKLFKFTQDQLHSAQKKIEELTIADDGTFSVKPLDEESEEE